MKSFPGNAQSEYGFILAIVVITAISGLMLLGSNLDLLLTNNANRILQPNQAENTNISTPNPVSENDSGPVSQLPAVEGTVQVSIRLSNGKFVNLSSYPSDLSKSIQTAGASGTTELLVENLRQLTRQLQDAGEIDAAQAQSLMELANRGHVIAEAHHVVEQGTRACGDVDCFANYTPSSSPPELIPEGYSAYYERAGIELVNIGLNDIAGQKAPYLSKLQQAYEEAEARGALRNPNVNKAVTLLTEQIQLMGKTMGAEVNAYRSQYHSGSALPPPDLLGKLATEFKTGTHANSANICTIGGDQDSGLRC